MREALAGKIPKDISKAFISFYEELFTAGEGGVRYGGESDEA
jgi:hypothetical protein